MKNTKRTTLVNTGVVIDNVTGEIIEPNSNNYKIIIEDILEQEDNSRIRFMDDVTFVRSFRGNGIMLNEKLTNSEIAAVVFLTDFVCYDDCVLRKNGDKRGKALTIQELAEIYGVKYDTFRRTIYSLRDKEVVGFHKTGTEDDGTRWITVNPYIFCRGIKISAWVVDFYSNTYWAKIVRQKVKEKRDMSKSK